LLEPFRLLVEEYQIVFKAHLHHREAERRDDRAEHGHLAERAALGAGFRVLRVRGSSSDDVTDHASPV
jgi:hypothetical protein